MLRWFSKERHARLEQLIELNDAYRGTALVLGDVVEADDTYTGEHCKGVVRLALDVAARAGAGRRAARRNVEFGALLHDVGKIAVPKEIVNKPGKLDEREWEIIKTHTVEGQRMLERVGGFMREVGQIVRSSPRALGRQRLPGRAARAGDPARGAHRLLLRRLQRDDHHALLSQGDAAGGGDGGAGEARRARSSTPRSSPRWWR